MLNLSKLYGVLVTQERVSWVSCSLSFAQEVHTSVLFLSFVRLFLRLFCRLLSLPVLITLRKNRTRSCSTSTHSLSHKSQTIPIIYVYYQYLDKEIFQSQLVLVLQFCWSLKDYNEEELYIPNNELGFEIILLP